MCSNSKSMLLLSLFGIKLFVLYYIYKIIGAAQNAPYGPTGDVKITSIKLCDDVEIDESIMTVELTYEENDDGETVLNSEVNLKEDLDNSFYYKALVTVEGSSFTYLMTGVVCDHLDILIPQIWSKIAGTAGIPKDCPIPAGQYSLQDFSLEKGDFSWPVMLYGHIMVNSTLLRNDQPISCTVFEIESTRPSN